MSPITVSFRGSTIKQQNRRFCIGTHPRTFTGFIAERTEWVTLYDSVDWLSNWFDIFCSIPWSILWHRKARIDKNILAWIWVESLDSISWVQLFALCPKLIILTLSIELDHNFEYVFEFAFNYIGRRSRDVLYERLNSQFAILWGLNKTVSTNLLLFLYTKTILVLLRYSTMIKRYRLLWSALVTVGEVSCNEHFSNIRPTTSIQTEPNEQETHTININGEN